MIDVDKAVIARMNKGKDHFEVLVDPEKAMDLKKGKNVDMKEVIAAEKIFSDSKKGLFASENKVMEIFGSKNVFEVAKQIILKGDVQVTTTQKAKLRENKMKQVITYLHRNAADPRTHLPHPVTRIELAFEKAKVKIDEFRGVEEQIKDIIQKLQPILPIKLEKKEILLRIPCQYASKTYSTVKNYSRILEENWLNDGSWQGKIEIASGSQDEMIDSLNKITRGDIEFKILKII